MLTFLAINRTALHVSYYRCCLMMLALYPIFLFFLSVVVCTNCINQLYNKTGGQFNERLLIWQPFDIFLYSTVIICICFTLCWKIKYEDDDDLTFQETL